MGNKTLKEELPSVRDRQAENPAWSPTGLESVCRRLGDPVQVRGSVVAVTGEHPCIDPGASTPAAALREAALRSSHGSQRAIGSRRPPPAAKRQSMSGGAVHEGLKVGLLFTATGLGFRHGIDWDHIAAITDIVGSQDSARRSFGYATLYYVGHGLVVGGLGVLAIVGGARLPAGFDRAMERVVGVTLMALGVFVLVSLIRDGRDFRMRSRWMLVFTALRRARRRFSRRPARVAAGGIGVGAVDLAHPGHHSAHHASGDGDPFGTYGMATSLTVGMLHGVGAETPTQVLLLVAAAGAGGSGPGLVLLGAFLLGLFGSNTLVAAASTFGFLGASRNFAVYATVSVLTGIASLAVGGLLFSGQANALPSLVGG
jgi:hypothetical protein